MLRASRIRLLVHGLGAGALLSGLRVPPGLDWTHVPAASATMAGVYRAAALLGLALSIDPARQAFREGVGSAWLLAVMIGYAVHGFAAPGWLEPSSRSAAVLFLLAFTFLLRRAAGRRTNATGGPVPQVLGRSERLGLVLVGLGTALAMETLAREVRLFTLGGESAETVVGSAFLFLCAAAAVSFGPLVKRLAPERVRFSAGVALAGASVIGGLWFVAQLTPDGLHGYLQRFDALSGWMRVVDARLGNPLGLAGIPALDGTSIGTLWATALLSAASFVGPAFLLGASLGALRHAGRLAYGVIGAAAGFVLQPWWIRSLAHPIPGDELARTPWSWTLLASAVLVSAVGSIVVAARAGTLRARVGGAVAAVAVFFLPWVRPRLVQWSFSPWNAYPILPELVVPTPEGLVTVERAQDGGPIVTLDRCRLTPIVDERELDERRLALSWALLPEPKRLRTVRGLFVGQMTPERSRFLRSLGSIDLERTAPWYTALPAVEAHLFAGEEPPLGKLVSPAEARERLSEDGYDWVVVPPVRGPTLLWKSEARALWAGAQVPRIGRLDIDDDALGVVWILADSPCARELSSESVVLAQSRFENLSIGVLRGGVAQVTQPLFATGEAEASPSRLELLRTLPHLRPFALEAAWTRRLERANEGTAVAALTRGLALHYAAQQFSSPYETRAQQIEIDEEALRAFAADVPASGALDPFRRELWEGLASLASEKRMPEEVLVYIEPLATRFAPWPALDRAVGHAYREVLEPESALAAFERALSVDAADLGLLAECAACATELGDTERARGYLERGLQIRPGEPGLERALGLLLWKSGDAHGRDLLERALARNPDDPVVRQALEAVGSAVTQDGEQDPPR